MATALLGRVPELAERLARRIRDEVDAYRDEALVPPDSLRESCESNVEVPLLHLAGRGSPVNRATARETGRVRALQDVPLSDTLRAFRIGFEFVWAELIAEARDAHDVSSRTLVALSSEMWRQVGAYSDAMTASYRETAAELLLQREHERSVLVEALFTGVIADQTTLWETARILGLPAAGPFIVVAAAVPAPGREALPGIEATLRTEHLPSAWRLLPDQQIGVLSVPPVSTEAAALRALEKSAARVGVSPPYDSLRDTPQALHYARLALAGLPAGRPGVARFDDNPVAMLVAAAPVEAARVARTVLSRILDLPDEERERLVETLEQWFAAAGSAAEAGRLLYCHANTVRYRLRRVEELTGRSLQDPCAVADFRAALQALRVVPEGTLPGNSA
ncbi:PucR family transcriptional regulator [Streptomyces piniterrae]|uniref:PucR family transcriptional regulator n=1 Tax=Streptomyces piniterrae TaxID=2571125 RepID=A0A4V5MM22_9ACTN|nr:PucR family transcriptional regulator [Streptomyces piniterrae]